MDKALIHAVSMFPVKGPLFTLPSTTTGMDKAVIHTVSTLPVKGPLFTLPSTTTQMDKALIHTVSTPPVKGSILLKNKISVPSTPLSLGWTKL